MRSLARSRTITVPLLTVVSLLAGSAMAAPPDADSAGASPRLKYLPKDYWGVAELDCGTVMKLLSSENVQKNPQFAQLQQYLLLVKKFTAIDPEKDLDWITVFASGAPEDKKVLLVVQGSFKNEVVAKALGTSLADSITETTYKKQTIYGIPNASLCFPEASTILVGDDALVHEAIDQLAAGPRKLPVALKSVLDRTHGKSVVWAALQPQVLLEQKELAGWAADNGDLFGALKKIECLSLSFDASEDGLSIKGLGYASAPGEAKKFHQYLSDRRKNLLHEEGSNVLFTSLLILSEIKTSGPFVEGSFRLTGQAFKELWETKVIVRPGTPAGSGKDR
jgi:hypothetical protein